LSLFGGTIDGGGRSERPQQSNDSTSTFSADFLASLPPLSELKGPRGGARAKGRSPAKQNMPRTHKIAFASSDDKTGEGNTNGFTTNEWIEEMANQITVKTTSKFEELTKYYKDELHKQQLAHQREMEEIEKKYKMKCDENEQLRTELYAMKDSNIGKDVSIQKLKEEIKSLRMETIIDEDHPFVQSNRRWSDGST